MLEIPVTFRPVRDTGKPLPSKAATTDIYEDLEPVILSTARRFAAKYHTSVEDTEAEARYLFLEAVRSHDPARGELESRVKHFIWLRLQEIVRLAAQQHGHCPRVTRRLDWEPDRNTNTGPFNLGELLEQLETEDSKQVVVLLLESPPELDQAIKTEEKPGPGAIRSALRRYLSGLGWTASRIRASFEEISGVL